MEQQPKIPTLKDAQKPQVKIKGMGAGLTLFDRLKQFKKKDLAFILAGLGTLFMAPLAEHFMMAPENGDLSSGFRGPNGGGSGPGTNLWGNGSSPYEQGGNGIAQGGAIGGAGDIITPLNVRDPSALVMGPGAAQQPPAGSAAPVTPPPTAPASTGEDYKDAIKGAATRAASAAVKKAPLPVPKIAVGGSGLRGLGAASGGNSSGSGSLGPINSGNLGQAGTGGGGLNLVRSTPGFRGAAGPRGPNSPSGLDGTKKAGQNAGDAFSRTGSALGGLNAAANEQIPTGGQGFGGGGQGGSGANDKPGGGAGAAGSKSVGESLAFIEAKERMMENLKLEFEKRKLKDPELLLYGIRNDSLKAMASEMTKSLTKGIIGIMDFSKSAAAGSWECEGGYGSLPLSTPECSKDVPTNCIGKDAGRTVFVNVAGKPFSCVKKNAKGDDPTKNTDTGSSTGPAGVSRLGSAGSAAVANLNQACTKVDALLKEGKSPDPRDEPFMNGLGDAAAKLVVLRDAMVGKTTDCGTRRTKFAGVIDAAPKPLADLQGETLTSVLTFVKETLPDVNSVGAKEYTAKLKAQTDSSKAASELLGKIEGYVKEQSLENPPAFEGPFDAQLKRAENLKQFEDIKKTLADSQKELTGYLAKARAAQDKLDSAKEGEPGILPQLEQIAGKSGTLQEVQKANAAYEPKKTEIEKVADKTTPAAMEPKVKAVADGAKDATEKIGKFTPPAPPEKLPDGSVNPKYTEYKKAATDAKTALETVKAAQNQWLVNVDNNTTTVKESVSGDAPKK